MRSQSQVGSDRDPPPGAPEELIGAGFQKRDHDGDEGVAPEQGAGLARDLPPSFAPFEPPVRLGIEQELDGKRIVDAVAHESRFDRGGGEAVHGYRCRQRGCAK